MPTFQASFRKAIPNGPALTNKAVFAAYLDKILPMARRSDEA